MPGLFVTFEGGEGTGKSTQARRLRERLSQAGHEAVLTREPGGSDGAEELRALLVTGEPGRWSAEAEALLNYAARDSHLRETIIPALTRGASVICDRFIDSTRVYQGIAGGCDMVLIDSLERHIVGQYRPQLTLVLDVNPDVGLARARRRESKGEDRFEKKSAAYHQRLRGGFLAIAEADTARCRVINTERPADAVAADIWAAVEPLLGTR
ncbi:dTMP kinase [soil metagenome]